MSGYTTQEDRDRMIEAFEKRETGTVEIAGQNPVEVTFLTPEELEEKRKGRVFGERVVRDKTKPYRHNAPVIVSNRMKGRVT